MSFLAPLFLIGLGALTLPIIFHLIRRTPRGQQRFSSLMFLSPSPPRLTRRSRLDQWLLLLLRATALILLAAAFARPFLREAANLSLSGIRGRRVAILLDASASMRRENLWQQASRKVEQVLAGLEAGDDVALYVFSDNVRPIVDFAERLNLERSRKPTLIRGRLAELNPTWAHTDLGSALQMAADSLDITNDDERQSDAALQIVLISDMQKGARLEALQNFEWPRSVRLAVEQVMPTDHTNAAVQLLVRSDEDEDAREPRVRVFNAADSARDQFFVQWSGNQRLSDNEGVPVYVPPGQSRVLPLPLPADPAGMDRVLLQGDQSDFDNTYFVVPFRQEQVHVVYVGDDPDNDPEGLLYYLQIATSETALRRVNITSRPEGEPLDLVEDERTHLVVVTDIVSEPQLAELESYLNRGGTVLVVPKTQQAAVSLASFVQQAVAEGEPEEKQADYVMLSDIDFTHPLFATFASPRYSDFTKIHFWQHRSIDVKDEQSANVVARFDNGQPALWEQRFGEGRVFVLSSGWHPEDSQLARSTKFVPLLGGILEMAGGGIPESTNFSVGDQVNLAPDDRRGDRIVHTPGGSVVQIRSDADRFSETNVPGIYQASLSSGEMKFAVNLATAESNTAPINVEDLEQYGVMLGNQRTKAEEFERQRQLRDIELENRQKLWRWIIVAAICVLGAETWLAGRKTKSNQTDGE